MARAQVGNIHGVAAVDSRGPGIEITADGANTVTVSGSDVRRLRLGMIVDFVNKNTGAVVSNGSAKSILAIDAATGVVTYSGTNADTTPGTHAIYTTGDYELYPPTGVGARDGYTNLNGGIGEGTGLVINTAMTIDEARARLQAQNGTTYSNTELDKMTYNDMIYALRVAEAYGGIK